MKPRLVSGIQPTGKLHLGNYLGALKNFVDLQNSGKYECYFFVADLHSLTEEFDPRTKREQILELTADFIAAGLNPSTSLRAGPRKSVIFQQSQVPAHSELAWILNTITPIGELRRMTQFKEKANLSDQNRTYFKEKLFPENIKARPREPEAIFAKTNVGLFDYPVLMAADVILYDAKFVPVGDDQIQHLELARTIARKFNTKFGKTFIEPQPILTPTSRIMSLGDPTKKMSKSQPSTCLFIDDSPKEIEAKIKRAVTDSGSEIKFNPAKKPAISNLLKIYSSLDHRSVGELERVFANKTYSEFKSSLAKLVVNHFASYRKKKKSLLASAKGGYSPVPSKGGSASGGKPSTLVATLNSGSKTANQIASKKIALVKKKVALTL